MNAGRVTRRVAGVIVHNWPLKLAAVILATLLYAGLVASQDNSTFGGRIAVLGVNPPTDAVITNQLPDVERIRYIAPAGYGPLRAVDFTATVDLRNVKADGSTVTLRVDVTAPPGVSVIEFFPSSIPVTLDQKATRVVSVTVIPTGVPAGIAVGDVTVDPGQVEVTGASTAVNRVAVLQVNVSMDGSAVNIDRDLQPQPLDANGNLVEGLELNPTLVNVVIPVFTHLDNRSVPVNPSVTGRPGAGFRIAGVTVDPSIVTVEGDLDQLQDLVTADTAPVVISGATRDITADVPYALPAGVTPIGAQTARVTVRIEAVTETRAFTAGISLDGRDPTLLYEVGDTEVLLTLFGSTADLDRIGASPIVISINVADLEPGIHEVAVVPAMPSVVTVAAISPETITIIVTPRPTPTPDPTPTPTALPSAPGVPTPAPGTEPTPTP